MNTETMLTIVAIVAAFGLLGVVIIDSLYTPYPVDARGCENSWPHSGIGPGANASKLRCFGH
jgi:hypothetical protein